MAFPEKSISTTTDLKAPLPANSQPSPFSTPFASLSMHMTDRLRTIQFPPSTIQIIQSTITRNWPFGIQAEREYYGSHEFKLKGNPWSGRQDESVHARRLMNRIFEALYNAGWVLAISTDISKKQLDKDTLIFRLQDPIPAPRQWMCMSFSKQDRLRFIDAPDALVRDMVALLERDTQQHGPFRLPNVHEFKLRGFPWTPTGGATMTTRALLLKLMSVLERHGFTVYASIDQKTGPGGDSRTNETDTWHVCRPVSFESGAPVYHG